MFGSLPLGILQLWHRKFRLLTATLGIAFAVILVFMQMELKEALYASAVRYHEALGYDLIMLSPKTPHIVAARGFPRNRLYQAQGIKGVSSVSPIYLGQAIWRHPSEPLNRRSIFVLGFDPDDRGFEKLLSPTVLQRLRLPYQVSYDRLARPEFGPIGQMIDEGMTVRNQVNDSEFTVAGLHAIGSGFAIEGSIFTSDLNFQRMFPERSASVIEFGLIHLDPGAAVEGVRREILDALPKDIRVLTRKEFAQLEIDHWSKATPTGVVFGFGVVMGLFVGAIIVYQILYSDVQDHLQEYATLLAMGYPHRYLKVIVLQEALVLAILGFLPGLVLSVELFRLTAESAHLPLEMSLNNALTVFALTLGMCVFSGLLTLRRLRSVDPAEVF
ncbi:ABC transporter permease DevC [Haliea sp. E17]|uniref:ABC transporter permease DevC n=1 Tax=Haliea sp. E17 TaxID=3401576 RepID=UPI003AABC57D